MGEQPIDVGGLPVDVGGLYFDMGGLPYDVGRPPVDVGRGNSPLMWEDFLLILGDCTLIWGMTAH